MVLEDHGDTPGARRNPSHPSVAHADAPLRGRVESGDQPEEGCLARAGGAEKRKKLATGNVERDVAEGAGLTAVRASESLAHTSEFDCRHGITLRSVVGLVEDRRAGTGFPLTTASLLERAFNRSCLPDGSSHLGPMTAPDASLRSAAGHRPAMGTFTRRAFLCGATAVTVVAGMNARLARGAEAPPATGGGAIPRRDLGRTGEKVSLVGLGGFHIGVQPDEQDSVRIVRAALDGGINFLDNCWDYNDGRSEVRMGKALRDGYREKAFLMTKIDGRTRTAAALQIDDSLRRLQTDHIDLLQFHEVIRENDPERIFSAGGGMEAALEAKKAGKIRFIGFTGHKSPAIHRHMLDAAARHDFTFDTVQMPLNVMDAHYDSFEKQVVPILVEHRIGVLGMKPLGSGAILRTNTVSAVDCLHYAMSLPVSVVITGCDSMKILDQALSAARAFQPLSSERRTRLLASTAEAAEKGQYEGYKTSEGFDATSRHPEWLG